LIFSSNTIIVVLPISGVTAIIKVYDGTTTTATLSTGSTALIDILLIVAVTLVSQESQLTL
jgi:hypothetical protein